MKMYDEMSIVKVGSNICFVKNEPEFNKGLDWDDREVCSIKYARRVLSSAFDDNDLEGEEVSVANINEDGTTDVVTFFTNGDIGYNNKKLF